jgi:hypothetical protein
VIIAAKQATFQSVEAVVYPVEALVHAEVEIVKALVGPAVSHGLHLARL